MWGINMTANCIRLAQTALADMQFFLLKTDR